MYESKILSNIKLPVFSLSDVSKLTKSRNYAKVILFRMVKEKTLFRLRKDRYSFSTDPLVYSPYLNYPSYVSCASALSYHGLISQIPNNVFLMTLKRPKSIKNLIYHKTKYFFGYDKVKINGVNTFIADKEKAFIDSIGIHPLNLIIEALPLLDEEKLLDYAKRTNQLKRISYLLKKEVKVSNKYIFLDPLAKKIGSKDKKWKLIVNC